MEIAKLYQLFSEFPQISIDSRNVIKNSLFFALKGENHDANFFAGDALSNGAACAIVDNPEVVHSDKYILVDDVLDTLQQLALHHRKKFNLPVIAITGSNGKTTTKELVAAVLSKKHSCLSTEGNLNNHIGVPLTLLKMSSNHRIAVIETGANHIGEIDKLCRIALPAYGLITNIGYAHLEGFGGIEGVIAAKTELYDFIREQMGKVFLNINDELLFKHATDISQVTYGLEPEADYSGKILIQHPFLELNCSENCTTFHLKSHLTGTYNAINIMAAVCIGRYFGVPVADIQKAIGSYEPKNNRSQLLKTARNQILLDAYNANPSSMNSALENFAEYPGKPKMCILGDMLELGNYTEPEHKKVIRLAQKTGFEKLVFVGSFFYQQKVNDPACLFFPTTDEAALWLSSNQINGYNILIKGSRKIKLESLVDKL